MLSHAYYIDKEPPAIVYVSDKETHEDGWGHVQFPGLHRLSSGEIILAFQIGEDSAESYGKDRFRYFISKDGKEWNEIDPKDKAKITSQIGLKLDDGTILSVPTEIAPKVDDLKLPEVPFVWMPYDYSYSQIQKGYRYEDLPELLRKLPLRRTNTKGESVVEHVPLTLENDFRMVSDGFLPMIFFGPLKRLADKSILGVFYTSYATEKGIADTKDGILLLHSKDEGKTWVYYDRLPYRPDVDYDSKAYLRGGFTEPTAAILKDGSLLLALRTADATPEPFPGFTECGPMYTVKRSLSGEWTEPVPISPYGVLPQLLKLKNDVMVLSYGRPGVQVRLSSDEGKSWTGPFDILEATRLDQRKETCGYTSLLEDPEDRGAFYIAYSHFLYETPDKKTHKAIYLQRCSIKGPFELPQEPQTATETPDKILEDYYPHLNGSPLAVRMRFLKGKLHGPTEGFYETGKPSFITPYREGKLHGVQKFFAPSGFLMRTLPFEEGVREGISYSLDANGNILKERYFQKGKEIKKEEYFKRLEASSR